MAENKLPIYSAQITDDGCGIYCVSLVTDPATEVNFFYFDKQKMWEKFAVANSPEHIVAGVIMLADTPIYRRDANGFEYYIQFSKETLKLAAEKMIRDAVGSSVNVEHKEGSHVDGVHLAELFVIDREKGIDPVFFKDVPDGSLIGFYKVRNDKVWEMIENGEVLSFSLEGIFDAELMDFSNQNTDETECIELMNKLINRLRNER